jgi:predicted Rossmann fold flavoprotein
MAAIFAAPRPAQRAAQAGASTMVIEANATPGCKLLLTGGGRCNFTHQAAGEETARAFGPKGRFLRYSLHKFPPDKVRGFFRALGLQSNVEQDGCVFPVTDRAGDVRDILSAEAKRLGVRFTFSTKVTAVTRHAGHFAVSSAGQVILAEKVIIATGGLTWPDTGSTGDGYKFAGQLGHRVVQPRPSLVPLVTLESWPGDLAGTSLKNVKISTSIGKKKIVVTGAMLFTHDGIGGPAALQLSRFVTDFLPAGRRPVENEQSPLKISIDLVTDISEAELEKMILKQASDHPKKAVVNILAEFVPRRVSHVLCGQFYPPDERRINLAANLPANQLSKDLRIKLLHLLKTAPLSIARTRPIAEATMTRGGVDVNEVEPKTMESKICPGLFFAGEILDVDGPCGGYNLQMCWSTGALAGSSAAPSK